MNQEGTEVFLQEASELLDSLEDALLDLEQSPDNRDVVDSAFRALHTIKGSGSMFGFEQVAHFAHGFETAFDRVRKGDSAASRELIAVALAAKDFIRTQIESPDAADPAVGERLLAELRRVVGTAVGPAETCAPAVLTEAAAPMVMTPQALHPQAAPVPDRGATGRTTWRLAIRFNKDVAVNGTNPLRLLDELREFGPCRVVPDTSEIPLLHQMEADACYVTWTVELETDRPRASILDVFIFVIDEMDLSLACDPPVEADAAPLAVVPMPAATRDAAVPAARSDVASAASAPALGESGGEPGGTAARREPETGRNVAKDMSTLRVAAERLDELMDRVGELVIVQARLSQLARTNADPNVKVVAEEIERLVSGLRDTTMGIRMVPVGQLFGRFRRLIHDLSHDLGKPVDLVTSGEETELDKTMIDRLVDPLVHIIRNAIDHGLEDQAARGSSGKPVAGRIELRAQHAGAEVRITVRDDGRGLDALRIRAKAEEQGLITPGVAMSEAELFQFLFHPGFSTAREISALSGRGVGMDVVKRTIEGLRGTIDLATRPGQGTEVTLRLPLTLAIIEGLLVRVGDGLYVVPLSSVEECVELSAADDARSGRRSLFNLRGAHLPFVRLRDLFDAATPADPHQKIVIVSSGDARIGLVVDQIIGNHQTVIKSLSKLQADVQSFSGATILGDGSVALIFDVPQLIAAGQHRQQTRREAA